MRSAIKPPDIAPDRCYWNRGVVEYLAVRYHASNFADSAQIYLYERQHGRSSANAGDGASVTRHGVPLAPSAR